MYVWFMVCSISSGRMFDCRSYCARISDPLPCLLSYGGTELKLQLE